MLILCWKLVSSSNQWACLLRAKFKWRNMPSVHYARSSIWPALKYFMQSVLNNTSWQLCNVNSINFWKDRWLSEPVVDLIRIPQSLHCSLNAKVRDFISNHSWCIPQEFSLSFPFVAEEIRKIIILLFCVEDQLVWSKSDSGELKIRDAFHFLNPQGNSVSWGKIIWSSCIPPSRTFLLWKLLHNKMTTDENLQRRGCTFVSICSLCGQYQETSIHLFLQCSFAKIQWFWLADIL